MRVRRGLAHEHEVSDLFNMTAPGTFALVPSRPFMTAQARKDKHTDILSWRCAASSLEMVRNCKGPTLNPKP